MEQPPGSRDDLQPQDLSTSSVPTVIDLTRTGEECILNPTSLDALRMVRSPSWYPNSGTSNPGLPFSETNSSDMTLQSGDQIQPDNAFSHTTVTLSYVSRSHVFPTHDSASRLSSLYNMPPIGKFALHPPCDSDKGLGETGYTLNQHYLEQVEGPVNLATQADLLQSLSHTPVRPDHTGAVCLMQEHHEVNGEVISSDGDMDTHVQGKEEQEYSLSRVNSSSMENGQGDSLSSSGVCAESSPETLTHVTGEDEERGGCEVLFVLSKKQDSVVIPDNVGARDLYSVSREYRSPLEDPVSPSAASLNDVEDVFILPQASSSPSGNNSFLETTEDVVWGGLSTEEDIQPGFGISDSARGLDSSNENKQPVHRWKAVIEPLIDLTDVCVSDVSEIKPKTVTPHMNGSTKALQRTLKEKKLPMLSGMGTRLETVVMDINSSRYKVSGCIRANQKISTSQSTASDFKLAGPKRNDTLSVVKSKGKVKASSSVQTAKQKALTQIRKGKASNLNIDICKESTSDSEILSNSEKSHNSTLPKSPQLAVPKSSKKKPQDLSPHTSPTKSKRISSLISSPLSVRKNLKKEPELLSHPDLSVEIHVAKISSPPSKSPKKSPGKAKCIKTHPTAKKAAACTRKRRQKKRKCSQLSSMFSPKEPEIKLKYVNYKEEKRDLRLDSFSPFIHVEHQKSFPSRCTVVNYPEEVRTQHKKGQQLQAHPSGFISAIVPNTSCLQLGRASMHSQHQLFLVCCLCGQGANAMDLGDLHGPYYPEGYQPSTKTPASISGLKEDEEDYSDSDSSSYSIRGRGRKCAIPLTQWPPRPRAQLKQKGFIKSHLWSSDSMGSPAAKRARLNTSFTDVADWYSPPRLPLDPCEYWLHEDCGIWSAGVFLVKGKVYGLEEAVKVAQETMCSACHDPGATLGCFFKSCPNKYHYRCALESADCVLIEENFSMKCKKHKNKTFKAPPGNRWDDR
uniref:transcription factor 20 isoform X1 n=1 Tax=Monopterus albus TaxID=43700 RepID=UPI0009B3146F|nr:transcription factor 20-like isoform X1 [Monopterus albus]XP_020442661.1 transcription factor 20-like isoform X1 [Monopterus albus]